MKLINKQAQKLQLTEHDIWCEKAENKNGDERAQVEKHECGFHVYELYTNPVGTFKLQTF